jgi:hypothetical protein
MLPEDLSIVSVINSKVNRSPEKNGKHAASNLKLFIKIGFLG